MSVNRFGELIGFAHAGMTAEGDNRCADAARLAMGCAKRLAACLALCLSDSCSALEAFLYCLIGRKVHSCLMKARGQLLSGNHLQA